MGRVAGWALLFVCACGSDGNASRSKHALVVGVDGLRVDALQQADTPALDGLIADGAVTHDGFAGGVLGEVTEQQTFSGPGWSSILTGVWTDKHGVEVNVFDDARFDEYPHFFARVRELNPDAYLSSFVTWAPINESILASTGADEAFSPDAVDSATGDIAVTDAVVAHLGSQTPDVVFVHLDEADHQGHLSGFSTTAPEYMDAVETIDAQIGQILEALRARETYDTEDWLVLVTTDHGGIDRGHGRQTSEERAISLIASGRSIVRRQTISPGPGHTAVPPTVMKHLGLEIDPAWGWESEPFGF